MGKEIERKFTVTNDLGSEHDISIDRVLRIRQTYLHSGFEDEVRVREEVDVLKPFSPVFTLTVKSVTGDKDVREEFETVISKGAFQTLTLGKVFLEKVRIEFMCDTWEYVLDTYMDRTLFGDAGVKGLVEIEFGSEEQARGFQKPKWLACEVTGEVDYKNLSLWKKISRRETSK